MINKNIVEIEEENIFLNITKKVNEYKKQNPDKKIISLGIGDVSRPIVKPVIKAMHDAVDDLSAIETFKGYGAYYGYDFLKEKILINEYKNFGFTLDEIYISNGTKTDTTSILELFDINAKVCITNPMYPIYRDGAKGLNRKIKILKVKEKDNFIAKTPKQKYDLIYICSPSNPIGISYTYEDLKEWVEYAIKNSSVILYDNVYESFITSENVPHSIYEIENARKVAIEFKSFSKKASFTGVRCSYYIVPNEIAPNINYYWKKRTINRFNGADYIAQKGAEATYLEESKKLIQENIDYYKRNAKYLRNEFINMGYKVWGGIDSPFMWVKTSNNLTSWEMFDTFLRKLNIIVIPGIIFGSEGDKYVRISALGKYEEIKEAIERIKNYEKKS